jgi:hypothetical protein
MSPERYQPPEQDAHPEQEPSFYIQTSRFKNKTEAGIAFFEAQELIFEETGNIGLSTYRFQTQDAWLVTVLGTPPPEEFKALVETILASGEPVTLSAEAVLQLRERREKAIKVAPWVEQHQGPPPSQRTRPPKKKKH